jgi:hypothetical protein
VQEHAHVRYDMVDSALLHILTKKICRFLFIVRMLIKKQNSVISNEQQHEVKAENEHLTQNVKILLERLRS